MNYLSGDIVEILSLTDYQLRDIRSGDNGHIKAHDIIGMRFKVDHEFSFKGRYGKIEIYVMVLGWKFAGSRYFPESPHFEPDQLKIYHRPFKNWLKYFYLGMKSKLK